MRATIVDLTGRNGVRGNSMTLARAEVFRDGGVIELGSFEVACRWSPGMLPTERS